MTTNTPTSRPHEPRTEPVGTPLVRKLAARYGVDLAAIKGTGVGGRVTKGDVLAAAAPRVEARATPPGPPADGWFENVAPAGSTPAARRPRPDRSHEPSQDELAASWFAGLPAARERTGD